MGNYENKNKIMKDAFMTSGERRYASQIENDILKGKDVGFVNLMDLGYKAILPIYDKAMAKVKTLEDVSERIICGNQIRTKLGVTSNGRKNHSLFQTLERSCRMEDSAKGILADSIIECVQEGRFNDDEMAIIENELVVIFTTMEDENDMSDEKVTIQNEMSM